MEDTFWKIRKYPPSDRVRRIADIQADPQSINFPVFWNSEGKLQ